jgi:predicted DNA-binding WGR domain protein
MNIFEASAIQAGRKTAPTVCSSQIEVMDAAEAGEPWLIYLISRKNKSNKFYELLGFGYDQVIRTNGPLGKKGNRRTTKISYEEALRKIKEKLKKGYFAALG